MTRIHSDPLLGFHGFHQLSPAHERLHPTLYYDLNTPSMGGVAPWISGRVGGSGCDGVARDSLGITVDCGRAVFSGFFNTLISFRRASVSSPRGRG